MNVQDYVQYCYAAQVAPPILAAGLFFVVFTRDRSKQRRLEPGQTF